MHLIRLGIAKEEPLIQTSVKNTDILLFKANLVAHMKDGLSAFLFNWNPKNPGYVIDPFLYAFQQDPEQFYGMATTSDGPKLKRPVQKLVEAYGSPLSEAVRDFRPLDPSDFHDGLEDFVRRVSDFQLRTLQAQGTELDSFFTYLKMDKNSQPRMLIAGAFSLDHLTCNEWLPINQAMAQKTAELYPSLPVYAQIIIDQDILWDDALLSKIIDQYNSLPVHGVIVWISGMSEHDAPVPLLNRYIAFLEKIHHEKIIWFGSYFSVMLARYFKDRFGVRGVAHGPGYGEDREVDPASGGFPVAKFYFPSLHRRLNFGLALMAARPSLTSSDQYFADVCDCALCRRLVNADGPERAFAQYGVTQPIFYRRQGVEVSADIPVVASQNYCAQHFLFVKETEYHSARTWEDAQAAMKEAYGRYRRRLPIQEVQHLNNWMKVLAEK